MSGRDVGRSAEDRGRAAIVFCYEVDNRASIVLRGALPPLFSNGNYDPNQKSEENNYSSLCWMLWHQPPRR